MWYKLDIKESLEMINEYLHQLLHVSKSVWYVLKLLKVHEVIFTNKTTVNPA